MKRNYIQYFLKALIAIVLLLVVGVLYIYGANLQIVLNDDMGKTDQSAYMNYARGMSVTNYTFVGGRNRMPLYPFLQSLFYRPSMTDEAFFELGKRVNLILSIGILVVLAIIFRQNFNLFSSFNLLLIVAFTVFIFKAGYFQAEILFYFLNFILFLLMWKSLQHISWGLAILTGFVAGLAHLTKASILPGLVIFFVLGVFKLIWIASRKNYSRNEPEMSGSIVRQSLGYLLVLVVFLITVFPYISTSKRLFGRYFYNVNSTFYVWYDSWETVKKMGQR